MKTQQRLQKDNARTVCVKLEKKIFPLCRPGSSKVL